MMMIPFLLPLALSAPLTDAPPPTSQPQLDEPCGQSLGDCASPLTCIPLSPSCTQWTSPWSAGCPGVCRALDAAQQRVYTLCGGWALMDDCDERRERCVADPRNGGGCGPACDGPGICWPFADVCGGGTGKKNETCAEGQGCFLVFDGGEEGVCLPLRFGSDYYEKTRLEEVHRTDQDGWQAEEEG